MIIKIAGEKDSWRFYDNARGVQYSNCAYGDVFRVEGMSLPEQQGVSAEIDGIVYEKILGSDGIAPSCICIAFVDHSDRPHHIYTDQTTYLLNDAGKTIERIF